MDTSSHLDPASSAAAYRPLATFFSLPSHLLARLVLFALLLALECLLRASLPHTESFLAPLASCGIAAFAVFLGLGYPALCSQRRPLPFHAGYFCGHLIALALLCLESAAAATGHEPIFFHPALLFSLRMVLAGAAVLGLALACIPLGEWIAVGRATGYLWLYAIAAGALTWLLRAPLQSLWTVHDSPLSRSLQQATFALVSSLLAPLIPALQTDAPGFILQAPRFAIFIAPQCSGLEGLGLVLVFTVAWLAWFRREFRFPRALLLIPVALAAVWLLNIVRIAALMLIGNSISPEIALAGFHSQAGWIGFTLVALSFSVASRHLVWIQSEQVRGAAPNANLLSPALYGASSHSPSTEGLQGESLAAPAYLVPLLAVIAASFVSKACSGVFEWLYPLRLLAALVALWCYRRYYRTINFRFSWLAPLTGLAVSLLWILPGLAHPATASPIAGGLAQLSPGARLFWIAARVLAAVVTVPLTAELAFRGFLARRLVAQEFETVPYVKLTLLPIAISSLAFGLLNGAYWPAGILAGLAFALLARSKNRLGEAIVAHATANLLLAAWILARGDFGLW